MFFTRKEKITVICLIILIAVISFFKVKNPELNLIENDIGEIEQEEKSELDEEIDQEDILEELIVHVDGAVKNPGLLRLKPGSRVADAIEEAGGLEPGASLDQVNLARKLKDEEKIYIAREDELVENNFVVESNPSSSNALININTCSKDELKRLPGIGDVIADRILAYREENLFIKIEDIKNVSGIGDKKFEDIKDLITVD